MVVPLTESIEKRKFERFDLNVPATASITTGGEVKEKVDLVTRDVCSGGAYFRMEQPLPVGTKMQIRLVLPMEKFKTLPAGCSKVQVSVSGKVLRIEPDGIGVCFDETYDIRPMEKNDSPM